MKVKLKEVLKLVSVLALFVGIYYGITYTDREWYSSKVDELMSEYQELDVKVFDFTIETIGDTAYVKEVRGINQDSLNIAINYFIDDNDTIIYNLTNRYFKDTSVTNLYLDNLHSIKINHNELSENIEDYTIYHNRLVSRFPSNLVVGKFKQINNKL
jgi:hypothetical protein